MQPAANNMVRPGEGWPTQLVGCGFRVHLALLQQLIRVVCCLPPEGGLDGGPLLIDDLRTEHAAT